MLSLVRSILFLLIVFAGTALAGQILEIELTDGSVISGEVLSLTGGIYRIRSGALGTVSIPQSKVQIIRPPGSGHNQSPRRFPNPMSGQLDGMQQTLMGNPDIMQMIQSW